MITSRGGSLAVGYAFPIITALLTIARFRFRRLKGDVLKTDDWLCFAAWFFVTGACATLLAGVYLGAFFANADESEQRLGYQAHLLAQITGGVVLLWLFADATIKLSILFFYRRIFRGKWFNVCSWALIAASSVWLIYAFISAIFYCGTKVHDDFEGPWSACPAWGFKLQLGVFILDTVIDFGLLILPFPYLIDLQLQLWRKVLLLFVFVVGSFAFVAGLMNTIYQWLLLTNPTDPNGAAGAPPSQTSDAELELINWPIIEIGVGLIACNLPTLGLVGLRTISDSFITGWRALSGTAQRLFGTRRSGASRDGASRDDDRSIDDITLGHITPEHATTKTVDV